MTNKAFEAIAIALKNMNPRAKKLIIVPDSFAYPNGNRNTIVLQHDFNIEDAIIAIANIKYVGIINAETFNRTKLSELIKILTTINKVKVVRLNASPISCKIFYPSPEIGTKHVEGSYEYRYGQSLWGTNWKDIPEQNGWGVRIKDKSQTDYECPLTTIQDYPVTSMAYLFRNSPATTLNLVNWDTSSVTRMCGMCGMFENSQATQLDLSSFDTSNVTNMNWMFNHSKANMLDLSSFDTSNVTNMVSMFSNLKVKHITARTKIDADKYQTSSNFPYNATVIINPLLIPVSYN